jgi:hypothetical protein
VILAKLILAIVVLVVIAWLIGAVTRDRTTRRGRRRSSR